MFDFGIPLEAMEKLEDKYKVSLHVKQYEDKSSEFYVIEESGDLTYVGGTIKKVKKQLKKRFGY